MAIGGHIASARRDLRRCCVRNFVAAGRVKVYIYYMNRKQIGATLKRTREQAALTIYAVEKRTGMQRNQIKNIEAGATNFTIDALINYSKALDCKVEVSLPQCRASLNVKRLILVDK